MVCKLKRSLYRLKQAPRQWYLKFDSFMRGVNFARCHFDHYVYYHKFVDGDYIFLALYVDDMLVAGTSMQKINDLKKNLSKVFEMKDLGEARQILAMQIKRES